MYLNRILLFSIALCVASAFASLDPLEARALKGRRPCVSKDGPCVVNGECCPGLTCSHRAQTNPAPGKKQTYVVFQRHLMIAS